MKKCPICDSDMGKRNGKYGEFMYCKSHTCNHTESVKSHKISFSDNENPNPSHWWDDSLDWYDGKMH